MSSVYGLYDPRDGQCYYVGFTSQKLRLRLKGHWMKRKLPKCFNLKWWFLELEALRLKPLIRLIEETDDVSREEFWILKLINEFQPIQNRMKAGVHSIGRKVSSLPGFDKSTSWSARNPEKVKAQYMANRDRYLRAATERHSRLRREAATDPLLAEKLRSIRRAAKARRKARQRASDPDYPARLALDSERKRAALLRKSQPTTP